MTGAGVVETAPSGPSTAASAKGRSRDSVWIAALIVVPGRKWIAYVSDESGRPEVYVPGAKFAAQRIMGTSLPATMHAAVIDKYGGAG
ncbi:MAG TPA: hypothetical protein VFP80_12535, partial [Thermoanaerobaculia bacterium]|nr:hypothetical protein [Thermoanaerobaculia bacterium]